MQEWFSLSDLGMEEALIEVPTVRRFAGIHLISDRIPDESTILTFRHLLEKERLGELIFETVKAHLCANGMTIRHGTIVDAALIAAPSSTKKKTRESDPDMTRLRRAISGTLECSRRPVKLYDQVSVDKDYGLIHSVETTSANVHEITRAAQLFHGDEEVVYGDAGYQGNEKRAELASKSITFMVATRPGKGGSYPTRQTAGCLI